jgi:hypothetical protein
LAKVNFLLGKAERLVRKIQAPKINPAKAHPYEFGVAKERIVPKLAVTATELSALPPGVCPHDEAVALVTLHPAYLAKSYFPDHLLEDAGLRPVGSRQRVVTPDVWTQKHPPDHALTAELFVAGPRKQFDRLAKDVALWTEDARGAADLRKIEDVRTYPVSERIRTTRTKTDAPFWEIILHASEQEESDFILDGFREYLSTLNVTVDLDKRLHAQGLCFIPVRVPRKLIEKVAAFSFLRAAREAPRMRPVVRMNSFTPSFKYELPDQDALDPTIRVVALDGGMPVTPDLTRWSSRRKASGVGKAVPELVEHGLGVTSALLFGPIEQGAVLPRPYARVEHYRVVDELTANDDSCEYFDVIKRIVSILESGRYEFANLSMGPDLPVEEDNIHTWTAMLDQYLRKGSLLMSIAAGNGGEFDHLSGNARIQSPADCVNGMAIGSADRDGPGWNRASHSSIGPGRSPGVVKPDLLSFGGCPKTPFYTIGANGRTEPRVGTSFASPNALRSAIGVRAFLGPVLSPLAIKALLIHRADRSESSRDEVGWGKVPEDIGALVTCEDGTAHIVYQGTLTPGSFQRAQIPYPEEQLKGKVRISATLCFASETDPQDPIHYTRSGLEIHFRPHDQRTGEHSQNATPRSFFNAKSLYAGEQELRSDAHKWETCLHASDTLLGKSLRNPTFDIHYNAREAGGKSRSAQEIPYALIVSVRVPSVADLYDRIYRRYRTILEVLTPVIQIRVRT